MKKPNRQAISTLKTVIIAILVSSILAFMAGTAYANKQQQKIDQAVQSAVQIEPQSK